MAQIKVLITGATGYVGGAVLSALLSSSNPLIHRLSITTPVRKEEQASALREKGVNAVIFRDLDDFEFLAAAASENDIVIHTASGFHLGSAVSLVAGLGARKKQTGSKVHYIHTSGTWNLESPRLDHDEMDEEFSDKTNICEHINSLESQKSCPQRTTLLEVVAQSDRKGVKSYCLMPPDIYGLSAGPFNQQPLYLGDLIKGSLESGRPEYVGNGRGGVGHVHITDLAALYELLLGRILKGEDVPSGRKGLIFTETLYHNWMDVSKLIGDIGTVHGCWSQEMAKPVSISAEEAAQKWASWDVDSVRTSFCLRNRTRPDVALELGWKPEKTEADWLESVKKVFSIVQGGE
ncbi:hypothetical protein B0T10DRAFT_163182 [Thelonectria olida]|uniref:3-beta hydroxysteroid dehydrogenase/isomerase domain-containing protein n=1 Tax=Thelonectria olida TaxID=1576542 RepID=A0A9P9AV34_9HYPO|nr:hypothetical protein B0T10DRAFT_163182 [Thelonectria olida]